MSEYNPDSSEPPIKRLTIGLYFIIVFNIVAAAFGLGVLAIQFGHFEDNPLTVAKIVFGIIAVLQMPLFIVLAASKHHSLLRMKTVKSKWFLGFLFLLGMISVILKFF